MDRPMAVDVDDGFNRLSEPFRTQGMVHARMVVVDIVLQIAMSHLAENNVLARLTVIFLCTVCTHICVHDLSVNLTLLHNSWMVS